MDSKKSQVSRFNLTRLEERIVPSAMMQCGGGSGKGGSGKGGSGKGGSRSGKGDSGKCKGGSGKSGSGTNLSFGITPVATASSTAQRFSTV